MATSRNFGGMKLVEAPPGMKALSSDPGNMPPADLVQDLPEGDAHGKLVAAGLHDLAADAVELGAGPGLGPGQALEPGAAVSDHQGHTGQGFGVVNDGGPVPETASVMWEVFWGWGRLPMMAWTRAVASPQM